MPLSGRTRRSSAEELRIWVLKNEASKRLVPLPVYPLQPSAQRQEVGQFHDDQQLNEFDHIEDIQLTEIDLHSHFESTTVASFLEMSSTAQSDGTISSSDPFPLGSLLFTPSDVQENDVMQKS